MFWAKSEKKQIILIVIILILIVVSFFLLFWQPKDLSPDERIVLGEVSYIINRGEENISEYQIEIFDNSTVFSLLKELAEREDFKIETTSYAGMGILVESINGFKGGTDNKWWQYWINGKLGEVAADKKSVEEGDTIEWRFEVPLEF